MRSSNWIFLRGLTRGNIHWGVFEKIFKQMNPSVKTEFLEIPGNGFLSKEKTPTDPQDVISYLRKNSQICKDGKPFHLCGISLGGMIALKWCELFPEEVESVTIINCSLIQFSPIYQRLIPRNYAKMVWALFNYSTQMQEELILRITSNKFLRNEHYLKSFVQFADNYKTTKLNFFRQLLLAMNIKIENKFQKPLFVFASTNDRLVSVACSKAIAKNLAGEEIIHPTSGHDLPLDEPVWLSEMLMKKLMLRT